ncbi:hypothetical protein L9F63_015228, partial [Diploptera punctata]
MLKSTNIKVFEAEAKYGAFYTGGQIQWTSDGKELLCQCGGTIKILDVENGRVTSTLGLNDENLEETEDTINTFTLSPDNESVVSNHRSGLIKLWNRKDGALLKQWKSVHKGPISCLTLNSEVALLASGGTDSSVRIWDLQYQSCTHNLRGPQGVISVVKFDGELVFAAGDDAAIFAWDLTTGQKKLTLSGHYSRITGLVLLHDTNQLVSCSRDRVIILWDLSTENSIRTIATFECLEGLILLPQKFRLPSHKKKIKEGIHVASAGEKGVIRVWEVTEGREVYSQSNSLVAKTSEEVGLAIVHLLFNKETNSLAVVSFDHNIIIHNLETFECRKQDEVLDAVFVGANNSHIAIATNSTDIKLYNMKDMDCQLLRGHTDLVLTLAATQKYLINVFQDNSVRIWQMDSNTQAMTCVAVGTRHTLSVGSVAFSQLSASFILSASQDSCLKMWKLPKKFKSDEILTLNVDLTEVAHDKDINSVCISPDDKLIATGSQDKTAK